MEYKLSDIFDLQMGKTPDRHIREYWVNGTEPWISIADLSKCDKYIYETTEHITRRAVVESGIKIIPNNTVIMSFKLSIGKLAITPFPMYSNEAIMAFVDKNVLEIDPTYLFYLLMYRDWNEGANKAVMGKTLNKATLSKIKIKVHSIEKQVEIVQILEKARSIIISRKQQFTELDELIKARFVEIFGDPISNPLEWPVKKLIELSLLITNGNTPKGGSENYVSEGVLFLRSQNVWRNRIDLDEVAYIDVDTHISMAKSSLHDKDILITKTGRINTDNSSLGRAALFRGTDDSANINGHIYLVRLDDSVIPEYVVAILTGDSYRKYIRKVCVGGIDKRQINLEQVEDFPIIMPPKKLQEQFAAFAAQVDKSKLP